MNHNHCFVYVIAAGESAVKVGMANNPQARVSDLQTGSFLPLRLCYTAAMPSRDIAQSIEALFHERAAPLQIHREWFSLTPKQALGCLLSVITESLMQCAGLTRADAARFAQETIFSAKDPS